ncbi:MAG: hypothetical protein R2738_01110 [Bacteroides graminisolvens]
MDVRNNGGGNLSNSSTATRALPTKRC